MATQLVEFDRIALIPPSLTSLCSCCSRANLRRPELGAEPNFHKLRFKLEVSVNGARRQFRAPGGVSLKHRGRVMSAVATAEEPKRIDDSEITNEVKVSENQFGFLRGRSTMEAIHLMRQLMEHYRGKKKDLHMVFIDLEKAYDKVRRGVLWCALIRKGILQKYISIIKDMYEGACTSVRTSVGKTEEVAITFGVHQGFALSPLLFDELTSSLQDGIPWCLLSAHDIVLVDETKEGVQISWIYGDKLWNLEA